MKFFFTILLVVLLLKVSAEQYAIAKYFESPECKPGQEAIWGAVIANRCTNQPQGNFSKK
jgi:hypothetical protein